MSVSSNYMSNRRLRGPNAGRPQAMVWADETPTVTGEGYIIPVGYELGSNEDGLTAQQLEQSFIILSDHNRSEINVSNERIEQRQRMANGTMRSFFIADKLTIETSWSMLPSRSFSSIPNFNQANASTSLGQKSPDVDGLGPETQYTVDGGAGGTDLLNWYENHKGPFWVLLGYDKYSTFIENKNLRGYSEARQMFVSGFNYSVVKRGGNNFDMWNVSVTLEEV